MSSRPPSDWWEPLIGPGVPTADVVAEPPEDDSTKVQDHVELIDRRGDDETPIAVDD